MTTAGHERGVRRSIAELGLAAETGGGCGDGRGRCGDAGGAAEDARRMESLVRTWPSPFVPLPWLGNSPAAKRSRLWYGVTQSECFEKAARRCGLSEGGDAATPRGKSQHIE